MGRGECGSRIKWTRDTQGLNGSARMKPAGELRRESNDGQSDARLSRWLFNYDSLAVKGGLGHVSMRAGLTLYRRRRPFRDKLSSQGGLRLPYIRESVWKR